MRKARSLLLAASLIVAGPAFAGWGYWSPVATGLPEVDPNGGALQYCFNGEDDPRYIMASVQVKDFIRFGHAGPGGELITLKALPWYYEWTATMDLFWWGDLSVSNSWGYLTFANQPSGSPGWAAFPPNDNNTRAQCRVM